MALIDDVKVNLRIKSTAFDSAEIQPIIDACKIDLKLSGVNVIKDSDPLTQRAVVLYVKANFGYSADSERYQKAYDMLKNSMALSGDYNTVVVAGV
ncbi:head-tail connector protein [Caproiciproducens sp.]